MVFCSIPNLLVRSTAECEMRRMRQKAFESMGAAIRCVVSRLCMDVASLCRHRSVIPLHLFPVDVKSRRKEVQRLQSEYGKAE